MSYLSTAIKRARYLVTRDTDQVLVLEKTNGTFVNFVLDTPQARDAAITAAVNALIAGAPDALNTLNELATALADDANFAATVTTSLGNRLVWRGTWAATTSYVRNDLVVFNGGLYVAPNSFTSGASFVKANWTELAPQLGTFPLLTGDTFTGEVTAPDFKVTGLPGAVHPGRWVGVTISGAPSTGTFQVGDFVLTQNGGLYVCTAAGTPGTWVRSNSTSPTLTGNVKIVNNVSGSVTPIIELDGFGRQFQGPMIDTSNAGGGRDLVLVDMFNFRRVDDLSTVSGSVAVTSPLEARFGIKDNGQPITGPGIPASTTLVWVAGTDSPTAARLSQAATATAVITAVIGTNDGSSLTDLFYVNEGGGQGVSFGFGYTPPPTSHRVAIAADDTATTQGNLRLRIGPSQSGPALSVIDSGGTTLVEMDNGGRWTTLISKGNVVVWDPTLSNQWLWQPGANGAGSLRLRYATGGLTALDFASNGQSTWYKSLNITDAANLVLGTGTGTKIGTATTQKLGFFNATPVAQPSGTPAAATDLASVIALANSLRTNALALGLVA